jgi:hypothetical protein
MENLIKVTKTTRASREGRLIFCPDCFNSQRVYHFAWAGLYCSNKECDFSRKETNRIMIDKLMWLVEKK